MIWEAKVPQQLRQAAALADKNRVKSPGLSKCKLERIPDFVYDYKNLESRDLS